MAIRSAIIFWTLLLGSLAIPVPEQDVDMTIFFENTIADQVEGRVVGGTAAAIGSHPWMVALTLGGSLRIAHCGGSVISLRTVLTAVHCIAPINLIFYSLRLNVGTNIRSSGGQSLPASGFSNHPDYNPNTMKNDVSLVYTTSDIGFNDLVQPIAVAFDLVGGGVQSRVGGFGMTGVLGVPSDELLEITVPTITGQQCIDRMNQAIIDLNLLSPDVDPDVEVCTFYGVGRGTCRGDSGSALVRIADNQQIGIVSWGFPCALGVPDMYVRTSAFENWINTNIQ